MSEWKEIELGEYVDSVSETYKFQPKEMVIFLNTSDILLGRVLNHTPECSVKLPGQAKKRIKQGDFLFSEIRPANGRYALINFDASEYVVSTKLMVLRCKMGLDINFFRHYIISKENIKYLQMIAEARSGTFPQITYDHISSLKVKLPSIPEQKAIASVLSSLDDKIDLLHRQNVTLEKMAETIFRQWFIEEAKEEWELTRLREVVDISIGRTPPRKESQWFSFNPEDIKWISIKDMGKPSVYILDSSEYLTREAVEQFHIPVIPDNTVILSFKMTVGRVAITVGKMLSNEAIAHFHIKGETPLTTEYLYFFVKNYKYDSLGSTSSIVTSINSAMLKDLEITIPCSQIMNHFSKIVTPMFRIIRHNQNQIQTLTALRDTLLPKLMSGEVKTRLNKE